MKVTTLIGLRYGTLGRKSHLASFITLMAFLGIVLGVSLLTLVLSVMNGFDKEVKTKILAMVPQASIHGYNYFDEWQSVAQNIEKHPAIKATAPFIHLQGMVVNGQKVGAAFVHAVMPEYENQVSDISAYVKQGSVDALSKGGGVILGRGLVDKLALNIGEKLALVVPEPSAVGRLAPKLKTLELVAILDSKTELDRNLAIIALPDAQAMLGLHADEVQGVRLKMDDLFDAPKVVREAQSFLPYGFYGRDWTQSHGNLYQAVKLSRQLVTLLLFVIIGVAAFNVVACLIIIVRDKEGDIAILRTMGMTPSGVKRVFMVLGAVIGSLGAVTGAIIGAGLSFSIGNIVAGLENLLGVQFLHSDVYPITYLPSDFRLDDVLIVVAVTLLLCFIATLYPARKAAQIAPAEILREQ